MPPLVEVHLAPNGATNDNKHKAIDMLLLRSKDGNMTLP